MVPSGASQKVPPGWPSKYQVPSSWLPLLAALAAQDEAVAEEADLAGLSVIGAIGGPLGDVGAVVVEEEAGGFVFGARRVGGEGEPEGKGELGVEASAGGGIAREEEGAVGGVKGDVEAGRIGLGAGGSGSLPPPQERRVKMRGKRSREGSSHG